MKYNRTAPCSNCPFRSDKAFPLRPGRVREIETALDRGEFHCHKTGGEENEATDDSEHCAGALILLEKLERPSQMMRICERLGFYDRRKLKMNAPVYNNFSEMERGCSTKSRPTKK